MKKILVLSLLLLSTLQVKADSTSSRPFDHVFLVILENENVDAAMQQPFLKSLVSQGTSMGKYFGVTHPSQPNYIAMIAGNTYGVTNDNNITIDKNHLGDLLELNGLSWKVYAEGYPGNCNLSASVGGYARKHVPFLSFKNVTSQPARCARITDETELDRDLSNNTLPNFAMYIPNEDNDGHDTDVAFADKYMEKKFGPLLKDPRFMARTLFIVTFDEGSYFSQNQVYATFIGDQVPKGIVVNDKGNHYNLLRTIEDIFGVGTLGQNDAKATSLLQFQR